MGPALVPLAVTLGGALISKMLAPKPPEAPKSAGVVQSTAAPQTQAAKAKTAQSSTVKSDTTKTGPQGLLSDEPADTSKTLLS